MFAPAQMNFFDSTEHLWIPLDSRMKMHRNLSVFLVSYFSIICLLCYAQEPCYSRWMQRAASHPSFGPIFNYTPFAGITLPGTHNSGTFELQQQLLVETGDNLERMWNELRDLVGEDVAFRYFSRWSRCQSCTIYEQLARGFRHIDLRVGWNGTDFVVHHALVGAKIQDILIDVRRFLGDNQGEIVMAEFSLFVNMTDALLADWVQLVNSSIGDIMFDPEFPRANLTYDAIVSSRSRFIGVLTGPNIPPNLNTQLFFVDLVVPTWTDVDSTAALQQSLAAKFEQLTVSDGHLIRLDWILTPSARQIQESVVSGREPSCLFALVKETNNNISNFMEIVQGKRLNVIIVDFADQTDVVRVAVKRFLCESSPCRDEDIMSLFRVSERCSAAPTCQDVENTPLVAAAPLEHVPITTNFEDALSAAVVHRASVSLALSFVAAIVCRNAWCS